MYEKATKALKSSLVLFDRYYIRYTIVMKYSFKLYKITIIYTTLLGHHKKF